VVEGGNVLHRVKMEGKLSRGGCPGNTSGEYVQEYALWDNAVKFWVK